VGALIQRHRPFFLLFTGAGIALRVWFILGYAVVQGDSLIYGDIAKNWLLHGTYGLSTGNGVQPTYIRLPGYPAFLAVIFRLFGMEHYGAAMFTQMFVDMASCFLIAALAMRLCGSSRRARTQEDWHDAAGLSGFALAALCPFTANYVAAPLAETWSIFLTVLPLYLAGEAISHPEKPRWWWAAGVALGAGLMFRPDAGVLILVLGGWLLLRFAFSQARKQALMAGIAIALPVLLILGPWTLRNWRTMHRFEPLAPRYANDPGDFVPHGFNRWVKTWLVDFISVQQVYWKMDGEEVDITKLPERAFDSTAEREQTEKVLSEYNDSLSLSQQLDDRFAELARQRIHRHPFRYYVMLPIVRMADMWLRPRTEMLPIEPDWWNADDHTGESVVAQSYATLNALLLGAALWGCGKARLAGAGALLNLCLVFVLLRTAFLGSLENPEPRYTLEMYPVVLALAGIALIQVPQGRIIARENQTF